MKTLRLFVVLLASLATTAGLRADETPSDLPEVGLVPQRQMLHIGIVVRDIDAAIAHWTAFLGLEQGPGIIMANGHAANPTHYRGHPSDAKAKLAFFNLDNLQVELIEPLGDDPSHWREFLEQKGEGVHHVAFAVQGIGEAYLDAFAAAGMPAVQTGGWETGEYGYMDTLKQLGVTVELIEDYGRPAP